MISHHLKTLALLSIGLVPAVVMAEDIGMKMSDQELAEKYAPVLINDIHPKGGEFQAYDKIDSVWYDVAQTSTHVFISYGVMKSWSQDYETEDKYTFFGKKMSDTRHPVDSEDVWVILKKDNEKSALQLVAYITTAHKERPVYVLGKGVDASDLHAFDKANKEIEADKLNITPAVQAVLNNATTDTPVIDETHAYVISCGGSHAQCSARVYEDKVIAKLNDGSFTISAAQGQTLSNKFPAKSVVPYKLELLKDKLEKMDLSPQLVALNDDKKALPCKPLDITLNGKPAVTPKVPSHVDPRTYLTEYNNGLLKKIQGMDASLQVKFLDKPEANYGYSHYNTPDGDGSNNACGRLDPAWQFKNNAKKIGLTKTAASQNASSDYLRYDLLSVKAKAFP